MIISEFGIFYNGIFQSVIGISINYFGFIFLSLSTYSFPTVSKLQEKSEIVSELNTNVRYIIMLMVPLIILLFVFRFFVISFLFSSEFGSSETLFTYQFLGDFFKALAWSIGIWLVPKMKLKDFVVLEIILNLNLVLIYFLLINVFGSNLEFVSVSYLLAYLIHFILNYMVSRKYLDYSLGKLNAKLLTMSLSFMIPLIVISKYNAIAGYFVVLPALIFWTYLTVGREDFEKIKSYLIAKVKDKS
jgi:O-antigen/teichoic acid export membrane protein